MTYDERLRSLLSRGEGRVNHMYLDTVGKVTVGVGNMIPGLISAIEIPFRLRATDAFAEEDDIGIEFEKIQSMQKGWAHWKYKPYTMLYLAEDDIDDLLDQRIEEFENGLISYFPDFLSYPDKACLGMMDMAFNLGVSGLVNKFKKFSLHALDQNWKGCADECNRKGISNARNKEVRELFLEA